MRDLKKTEINHGIYLYPVPVNKDRKYLIHCLSIAHADTVLRMIREKKISHPDLETDDFIFKRMHVDQQTKIFILNPERDIK